VTHKSQLVGHRGCRNLAIENSYDAFKLARDAGLRSIETDIRITADGYLILHHDKDIDEHLICDSPLRLLKQANPSLLTVAEAAPILEEFEWLQLEIKPIEEPHRTHLVTQLLSFKRLTKIAALTSFDQAVLRLIRTMDPKQSIGVLEEKSGDEMIARAKELNTHLVLPSVELSSDKNLSTWVASGYQVSIFTQNSARGARHMLELGAHSIITDNPHLFDES